MGGNSVSAGDEVLSWSMKREKTRRKGRKGGRKEESTEAGLGIEVHHSSETSDLKPILNTLFCLYKQG